MSINNGSLGRIDAKQGAQLAPLIDRKQVINFTYDGEIYQGFAGDTLASALMANGIKIVGRSFKYHRARGIYSAGAEEPSALVTVGVGAKAVPNTRATMLEIYEGMVAKSQNCWPSPRFDLMAVNQLAGPLFSAGFYYKTFMGPTRHAWHFYEHFIRQAAGMGKGSLQPDPDRYEKLNLFCDVLVVGSGPAGLAAARTAAASGARVLLADEQPTFGGALRSLDQQLGAQSASGWLKEQVAELVALPNVTLLNRTTVYGYYDDNTLGAVELLTDHCAKSQQSAVPVLRQRHWVIRARQVVLAAGAIERPLMFAGNDLPGVMLADAVQQYVRRYAVLPGQRIALYTNNDSAYGLVETLAGLNIAVVAVIDTRADIAPELLARISQTGTDVYTGYRLAGAKGGRWLASPALKAIEIEPTDATDSSSNKTLAVDCLAVSGGWTPSIHLASQSSKSALWSPELETFLPGEPLQPWCAVGAMAGQFALSACLQTGAEAGAAAVQGLDITQAAVEPVAELALAIKTLAAAVVDDLVVTHISSFLPAETTVRKDKGKTFVDLQHDVTANDVFMAHSEGYRSVEHLKRYTTLGMATDQGKTSNLNALMLLAQAGQRKIPEVGTTRFRPPYTPVALGALAGQSTGAHFKPLRKTAMHDWHMANGGDMVAVGLWQRPRAYLRAGESVDDAYRREAGHVRKHCGLVDVSTLGKIDVQGPDAAEFLQKVYTNNWLKLPIGKARYGVMLREDGVVFDDGTTWRLDEHRYLMTTTTAHAGPVLAHLEFLLATVWPELRVNVTSITDQWAAMAIAGPKSRDVLAAALSDIDLSEEGLPFMGVREGRFGDVPVLVARLSFSGERAYEVYCGTPSGHKVWTGLLDAGADFNIVPYGTEAMATMRIEKGHVAGPELDGRTTALELGLAGMGSKNPEYVGSVMQGREGLVTADRHKLVGLVSMDGKPIRSGSHLVSSLQAAKLACGKPVGREAVHSEGHVASTTFSPALDQSIALGLLAGGLERLGETVYATFPLNNTYGPVKVVEPCFFDPDGSRLYE